MSLVLQDQLVLSPATADHLQEEIDAIEAGSDVTDVVGTYADLEDYDTSKLTDNDIIKVLQDETQDNAQTYYRWSTSSREFTYVGKVESKTYTAGNGIDITNDTISVTDPVLIDRAPATASNTLIISDRSYDTKISSYSVAIGKNILMNGDNQNYLVVIGSNAKGSNSSVTIGTSAECEGGAFASVAIGSSAKSRAARAIGIGGGAWANGASSVQIGQGTNDDANTFKVGNGNGNFEIMSADGTIPEARLADTTSATSGQVLQLDSNNNAIWADVDGLPDQTGQSGKFLTTDGTDASWGDPLLYHYINIKQDTSTTYKYLKIGEISQNAQIKKCYELYISCNDFMSKKTSIFCQTIKNDNNSISCNNLIVGTIFENIQVGFFIKDNILYVKNGYDTTSVNNPLYLIIPKELIPTLDLEFIDNPGSYNISGDIILNYDNLKSKFVWSRAENLSSSTIGTGVKFFEGTGSSFMPTSNSFFVLSSGYYNTTSAIALDQTTGALYSYTGPYQITDKTLWKKQTVDSISDLVDQTSATQGQVLTLDSNNNAVWADQTSVTFRTWVEE